MKKLYTSFSAVLILASASAQLQLKPAIGPTSLPADTDPICNIICSTTYNFNTGGLQIGDTIPQFQFYSVSGTPTDALTLLQTGKPLCIVAGSYTCPVWRGKIAALNTLVSTYGSQVNFLVVYVVEAHPNTPDVSPYSCSVWITTQNQTDGVLYLQPTTYGARKIVVTDQMNNSCTCIPTINAPVVIDGPCNDFWTTFGEAPNNAYLINPLDGTVSCKHGWFNQAPLDMADCIDSLLNFLSVNETSAPLTTIYPNPASENMTVNVSLKSEMKLYNSIGEEVGTENLSVGENNISVANLAKGIYFVQIISGGEIIGNKKLLIQ